MLRKARDVLRSGGEAFFDVIVTFDHHSPELSGELSREGLGCNQASGARGWAPVEVAQRDVFAAHQALDDHVE